MDRIGEITKVDGPWLEITFCRPSDCDKCHACMGGAKETTLRLRGKGSVGDTALVSLPASTITKASALAYLLPLGGLFAGMLLGDALLPLQNSLGALIGAVMGIGIPTLWLVLTDKKRQQDPKWTPQIVSIIPKNDE